MYDTDNASDILGEAAFYASLDNAYDKIGVSSHPLRQVLNDEVHAKSALAIQAPNIVSVLILPFSANDEAFIRAALCDLANSWQLPEPGSSAVHYSATHARGTFSWSRHTEFFRLIFSCEDAYYDFSLSPLAHLPHGWLANLPGSVLVAMHVLLLKENSLTPKQISSNLFAGHQLIGAEIGKGNGLAFTDLRLHPDMHIQGGASRFVVIDRLMGANQSGRMIQRLIELETYRMFAFLALPLAKQNMHTLDALSERLKALIARVGHPDEDDAVLLDALSALSVEAENMVADSEYRYAATQAYHALIRCRASELREQRLPGIQPFREFIERRLEPAMETCRTVTRRQDRLMRRLQRAGTLLRTRVEVTHERQNQTLLASVNRRAALQVRMQETVESLSVVVLTYYFVALFSYGFKALQYSVPNLNVDIVTAGLILPMALFIWWSKERLMKRFRGVELEGDL